MKKKYPANNDKRDDAPTIDLSRGREYASHSRNDPPAKKRVNPGQHTMALRSLRSSAGKEYLTVNANMANDIVIAVTPTMRFHFTPQNHARTPPQAARSIPAPYLQARFQKLSFSAGVTSQSSCIGCSK
jgi:hypothetical protein